MSTDLGRAQQEHWQSVYQSAPHMYGDQPSEPCRSAVELFRAEKARTVLELGAGHGRDALFFAERGFHVRAADFSSTGVEQLRTRAQREGLTENVTTLVHDVRDPIPMPESSVDAVFAHMLLCMALSTDQVQALVREVRRVLRPGGVFVYTARHTGDDHFGTGVDHGDGIYEQGGFAVHFFDDELVSSLARGWELREVHAFEEGELPRRLWRVTQIKR
jgi:SAM-dependent methyltransferase